MNRLDPRERSKQRLRVAAGCAVLLTWLLVMLGAWVRLNDAGLGCPDWPGCYGHLTPDQASDQIARAVDAQGGEHGPVSMAKAWREMLHRYVATSLGVLILGLVIAAGRARREDPGSFRLGLGLLAVVVLQGLFGKWTVTLLLKPAIVTGHLVGGMLTLMLLVWFWLRHSPRPRLVDAEPLAALALPARWVLAIVAAQVFLGGWTSTNYAALACTDLPTCQGSWWPSVDFVHGFQFIRELGRTVEGAQLPVEALTAIHLVHRMGAVVVLGAVGWIGWRAARTRGLDRLGLGLLGLVIMQWALGLSNVWFSLPLPVAVAHNGGAAALLALLVVLNFRTWRARYRV